MASAQFGRNLGCDVLYRTFLAIVRAKRERLPGPWSARRAGNATQP